MSVDIFWIPFEGPGRIGISTRPSGGDWLKDDIRYIREAGTDLLVSMLTPAEVDELKLWMEKELCQKEGLVFQSIPIQDRGVPQTRREIDGFVHQLAGLFESGTNIIIHCRQGIGRSAMMIALVMVARGMEVNHAFEIIAEARGRPVPDTEEQHAWVEQYAAGLNISDQLKVAEKVERYQPEP
jgi:protein-tyrosine phosphatase